MPLSKRCRQLPAAAVRVTRNPADGRVCRSQRTRTWAKRIFVGGQLDDIANSQFALQFLDGLPGQVWLQGAHTGRDQLEIFIIV